MWRLWELRFLKTDNWQRFLDGTTTRYLNILKNNPMEAILSLNIENPKGIRPMVLDLIYDDGLFHENGKYSGRKAGYDS